MLTDKEKLACSDGEPGVVDGLGVRIVHSAALSDLDALEKEMLNIGSHFIRKAPPDLYQHIDRAGLCNRR